MAKTLPPVGLKFAQETERSLQVVSATEALWLTAPPASEVRRQLKVPQLEALYEAVYLRIFASWENALEALVVYHLAGYRSPAYVPQLVTGSASRTLKAARSKLYGSRDYLLWHNPGQVVDRVNGFLVGSPVELVVAGAQPEIENFAAVRHAIAHGSPDAKSKFQRAVVQLSGYQHAGVGRFLRAASAEDPLNPTKWILRIRDRLVHLVTDMTL